MNASTPWPSNPPHRRRRRAVLAAAPLLALTAAGVLAGCGSDAEPAADSSASTTPSPESGSPSPSASAGSDQADQGDQAGQTIRVRIEGEDVTPSNERIEVAAGEPLTVRVVSDREGELHVHSSPETTFDFGPGTSSKTFTIERPGIVEMEEHDSDTLVAQLEAR